MWNRLLGVVEFVGGCVFANSRDCMTCRVTKPWCFKDEIQIFLVIKRERHIYSVFLVQR